MPCSGKSTWAKKHEEKFQIVSCDFIRQVKNKGKFIPQKEPLIWETFYSLIDLYVKNGMDIIIDNTNLQDKFIKKIKEHLTDDYVVIYKHFPITLWEANLRNYKRYFKTGKWIPRKVMKRFYVQSKKLFKEYLT
jgi:predicted kinase